MDTYLWTTTWLLLCIDQVLAKNFETEAINPTPSPTASPNEHGPTPEPQSSSQMSNIDAGTRAGVAIGCLLGMCLLGGLGFLFMKKRKEWIATRANKQQSRDLHVADIIRSRAVQSQALTQQPTTPELEKSSHLPMQEPYGLEITRVELEGHKFPDYDYTRGPETRADGSF